MPKSSDIRLVDVKAATERFSYRTPIKFGGRIVNEAVLLNVTVMVETRTGKRAVGRGSMPIGNVWAWPSANVSARNTLEAMIQLGLSLCSLAKDTAVIGHPLEITHQLAASHEAAARSLEEALQLGERVPRLAQLVAASPLEAAIHDAYGVAHAANSYDLLGTDWVNTDLSAYLGADFAGKTLDEFTLRKPKPCMPLYHLVGALDPLTPADVVEPVGDGLPETLGEWIAADGLSHLKVKLAGDDLRWDVDRLLKVERVAADAQAARSRTTWHYSLDFNERCKDVNYVLDFLAQVRERAPAAFERIQYIEQPTHRDLKANAQNRMHAASKIKPVVIDESLIDLESLLLCRELGYTGVALKACKGHSEALLMGAAAQHYGMFLCVQDLTCPGRSFLQSASLAARLPTVAAIEGNARQYIPAANAGWDEKYPAMFSIRDGTVGTAALNEQGLGFSDP